MAMKFKSSSSGHGEGAIRTNSVEGGSMTIKLTGFEKGKAQVSLKNPALLNQHGNRHNTDALRSLRRLSHGCFSLQTCGKP